MSIHFKNFNTRKGLSLLELVLSIAIISIIVVLVGTFQFNVFTYNSYGNGSISTAEDAHSILRTMVKELRPAKPGSNGAYPLITVASSTIAFYSDINSDGLQEQVRYFLSTTTLMKGVIVPTGVPLTYNPAQEKLSTLAYNVRNGTSTSLFEYFDETYSGTSSPLAQPVSINAVRLVRINLLLDADPNKSPNARLYTSDATLRNLKDNL